MGNPTPHTFVGDTVTAHPPLPQPSQQQQHQPQYATITDVEAMMANGIANALHTAIADSRARERENERKVNMYKTAAAAGVIFVAGVGATLAYQRFVVRPRGGRAAT